MKLSEAIGSRRKKRETYPIDAGWEITDQAASVLADAYLSSIAQQDRKEGPSEDWLKSKGFEWVEALGSWFLDPEECFPLLIARSATYPNVWVAHIDDTPWPIDLWTRGQIYDLCLALERPLSA